MNSEQVGTQNSIWVKVWVKVLLLNNQDKTTWIINTDKFKDIYPTVTPQSYYLYFSKFTSCFDYNTLFHRLTFVDHVHEDPPLWKKRLIYNKLFCVICRFDRTIIVNQEDLQNLAESAITYQGETTPEMYIYMGQNNK